MPFSGCRQPPGQAEAFFNPTSVLFSVTVISSVESRTLTTKQASMACPNSSTQHSLEETRAEATTGATLTVQRDLGRSRAPGERALRQLTHAPPRNSVLDFNGRVSTIMECCLRTGHQSQHIVQLDRMRPMLSARLLSHRIGYRVYY